MKIQYLLIAFLFLISCTRTELPNTREIAGFQLAYSPERIYIFEPEMLRIKIADNYFPADNEIKILINDKVVFEGKSNNLSFLTYTKDGLENEIKKYKKEKPDERLILDLNRIFDVVNLMNYKPIVSESEYRAFLSEQLEKLDRQ